MTPAEAIAVAQGWASSPERLERELRFHLDAVTLADALYAEHSATVAEHGLLWDEHVERCGSASCVVLADFAATVERLSE